MKAHAVGHSWKEIVGISQRRPEGIACTISQENTVDLSADTNRYSCDLQLLMN